MSELVPLLHDVSTACSGIPHTPIRVALGATLPSWSVFRLLDPNLAAEISAEIDTCAPRLSKRVMPLEEEVEPWWQHYNRRKRITRASTGIYVLGPRDAPEEWVAVARLTRELACELNGMEEYYYTAMSALMFDRNDYAHDALMACVLGQDLGAACAKEAVGVASRAREQCVGLVPRVGCNDPGICWLNMRPIEAFVQEFKRGLTEAPQPAERGGVQIVEPFVELPWGER